MGESNYRKRMGDRKDGRRLRSLSPVTQLMPFIMVKRNDGCNLFNGSIEVSATDRWLREKRQAGYKGIGVLHLLLAAYVRVISQLPGLNRFISGQRIYARNSIEVNMMVKRGLSIDSEETLAKIRFEPTDTIFDVYRRVNSAVDEVKAGDDGDSGTEKTASALLRLPGLFLKFAVWVLNLLDYFGWLPRSITEVSPFHGSMIITDLGSLAIPPIYHHLYNFGNLPVFVAFGAKRHVVELDRHGQAVEHKYVDYKVTCDERIVDGSYYAMAFKLLKYYMKNPQELEHPPAKVVEDVF